MILSVAEEQGAKAAQFAVTRPTVACHQATIAFASNKDKAPTPATQHHPDDGQDTTSASQLAMRLRGGSHDYLICLICQNPVAVAQVNLHMS